MAWPLLLLCFLLLHLPPLSAEAPSNATSATATLLTPGVHLIPCIEASSTPCARVYLPSFLDPASTSLLLSLSASCFAMTPGGSGPVTLIDFVSGALSWQDQFISAFPLFARNHSFFPLDALSLYLDLTHTLRTHIATTLDLPFPLYLTRPSFLAQLSSAKPCVTPHDEYWHPHVDLHQYGSFEFTALVYLSDWGEDFTGGEFVFVDEKEGGEGRRRVEGVEVGVEGEATVEGVVEGGVDGEEVEVRPLRGSVLYFTSGGENVHFVRKLRTGQRSTLTIAFTRREEDSVEAQLRERYGPRIAEWKEQQAQGLQEAPDAAEAADVR